MLWTTTYLGHALDALRAEGHDGSDDLVAHLTPAQHDHITFYGTYSFNLEWMVRQRQGAHLDSGLPQRHSVASLRCAASPKGCTKIRMPCGRG